MCVEELFQRVSGPGNVVSGTVRSTQCRREVPASAGTAFRVPRARPAAGGRAEYWGEILTAQKKYLPNVPGFSFSCCWKPQGYWVWHIKVQKSSRD